MLAAQQRGQAQGVRHFALYAGSSGGSAGSHGQRFGSGQGRELVMAVPSAIVFYDCLDPEALADAEERAEVEANVADLCRPYGQLEGVHAAGPEQPENAGMVYVHFAAPSQVRHAWDRRRATVFVCARHCRWWVDGAHACVYGMLCIPQALAAVEGLRGRIVGGEELKVTLWCPSLLSSAAYSHSASPPGSPAYSSWGGASGGGGHPLPLACFGSGGGSSSSSIIMHGFALTSGAGADGAILEDAGECEEVCANAQQLAELFGTVLSVRVVREPEEAHGGEEHVRGLPACLHACDRPGFAEARALCACVLLSGLTRTHAPG